MAQRKQLPTAVRRAVLVEAGHRCAIPTCRAIQKQVHHIKPVKDGGPDTVENLIVLCPNCHDLVTRGDIDRKAVEQYKTNLQIMTSRYTPVEENLVSYFVMNREEDSFVWPGGLHTLVWKLLHDGIFKVMPFGQHQLGKPIQERYILTDVGHRLIDQLRDGSAFE